MKNGCGLDEVVVLAVWLPAYWAIAGSSAQDRLCRFEDQETYDEERACQKYPYNRHYPRRNYILGLS